MYLKCHQRNLTGACTYFIIARRRATIPTLSRDFTVPYKISKLQSLQLLEAVPMRPGNSCRRSANDETIEATRILPRIESTQTPGKLWSDIIFQHMKPALTNLRAVDCWMVHPAGISRLDASEFPLNPRQPLSRWMHGDFSTTKTALSKLAADSCPPERQQRPPNDPRQGHSSFPEWIGRAVVGERM